MSDVPRMDLNLPYVDMELTTCGHGIGLLPQGTRNLPTYVYMVCLRLGKVCPNVAYPTNKYYICSLYLLLLINL